jgi:hypothetical protein
VDLPADVPYAMIQMMPDLQQTVSGEGTDAEGKRFMIQRYVSKTTGKIYDCVFSADADMPKCAEMPVRSPPKPE